MRDHEPSNQGTADELFGEHDSKSPESLMRTLQEDIQQVRVGNGAPENVPVFRAGDDPKVRYVRFADLSNNVRHILDICSEVDVHVEGRRRSGSRTWREIDGWRSPVLQWTDENRAR